MGIDEALAIASSAEVGSSILQWEARGVLAHEVRRLRNRLAALDTGPAVYAVRWVDPDGIEPDEVDPYPRLEDAEHAAARFRSQGVELVKARRGPWEPVVTHGGAA